MIDTDQYYFLTPMSVEEQGLHLEGNGGFNPAYTLGGSAFMSSQPNASGTMWKFIESGNGLYFMTTLAVENQGLHFEGNGGVSHDNTLGGAAFMSPQADASGTMWKLTELDNGYFQLTTLFVESKGLVLEGNGGLNPAYTLGGAAFMSPQTDASGTMWTFVAVSQTLIDSASVSWQAPVEAAAAAV